MRLISWALCLVLAAQVYAQGSAGGVQYPPCNAAIGQTAQYYGCWDITPFSGASSFYNVSITGSKTSNQYYPGWVSPGDLYADSVTPANCTTACRGHGYKFSALFNGQVCQCGAYPPFKTAPKTSLDPKDTSGNSCHVTGSTCYGDSSQFCGKTNNTVSPQQFYADIYVDNSFPLTIDPTVEQNNYKYLGCYAGATLAYIPYSGGPNASSTYTTAAQCFYTCAQYGFTMAQFSGGSYASCQCGSEISLGSQVADNLCKSDCATGTTCNPLSGQVCCGRNGNNPIYVNQNLVGCYEPRNPGTVSTVAYSVPNGAPTTVGHIGTTAVYPGPVVVQTNPPSVPPAIPQEPAYTFQGCFGRIGGGTPIVSGFTYTDTQNMTVDTCWTFCSQYAISYVSLTGGSTCACGTILGITTGQAGIENCRILCPGNTPPQKWEYCGGSQYEQIYSGTINNPIASTSSTASTTTVATITSSSISSSAPATTSVTTTQSSSSSSSVTPSGSSSSSGSSASSSPASSSSTSGSSSSSSSSSSGSGTSSSPSTASSTSSGSATSSSSSTSSSTGGSSTGTSSGTSSLITNSMTSSITGSSTGSLSATTSGTSSSSSSTASAATTSGTFSGSSSSSSLSLSSSSSSTLVATTSTTSSGSPSTSSSSSSSSSGTSSSTGSSTGSSSSTGSPSSSSSTTQSLSSSGTTSSSASSGVSSGTSFSVSSSMSGSSSNSGSSTSTTNSNTGSSSSSATSNSISGTSSGTLSSSTSGTSSGILSSSTSGTGSSTLSSSTSGTSSGTLSSSASSGSGSTGSSTSSSIITSSTSSSGSVTTSANASGTSSTTSPPMTATTTSSSSTVTPSGQMIIGVATGANPVFHRRHRKRSGSSGYINSGSSTSSSCSNAQPYTFNNGQLSSNGNLVSTNLTSAIQPFGASPYLGTVTGMFNVDSSGNITWTNPLFTPDGIAYFIQTSNGSIYSGFHGYSNSAYPQPSTVVYLIMIPASYCQNGVIVYPTTSSTSVSASSTSQISDTQSTTGAASTGADSTTTGTLTNSDGYGTLSTAGTTAAGSTALSTSTAQPPQFPSSSSSVLPPNIYLLGSAPPGLFCVNYTL